MKRILVPTDFSANARRALDFAIDIAKQYASDIILLHTYKLKQRAGTFIAIEQKIGEDARQEMSKLVDSILEQSVKGSLPPKVSVEGTVLKAVAVEGICRYARRKDIDLIVMGTRGASGWQAVMGSTTSGVIHHTRLPVLAIPEKAELPGFKRVVLAVDGKPFKNEEVFAPLKMLANTYNWEIHAIHIKKEGSPEKLGDQLEKELAGMKHTFQYITVDKEVNAAIHDFADELEADLVCLVKRHRNFISRLFHQSVVEQEAYHSNLPILILHDMK